MGRQAESIDSKLLTRARLRLATNSQGPDRRTQVPIPHFDRSARLAITAGPTKQRSSRTAGNVGLSRIIALSSSEKSRRSALIDQVEGDLERLVGTTVLLPGMLAGVFAKLDELDFILRRSEESLSVDDFEV